MAPVLNIGLLALVLCRKVVNLFVGGADLEAGVWGVGFEAYRLALLPVPLRSEQSSLMLPSWQLTAASLATPFLPRGTVPSNARNKPFLP